MTIINLTTFDCSVCGESIPDKDLEKLVKARLNAGSLVIVCPACLAKELKDKEVAKRRESLVLYVT